MLWEVFIALFAVTSSIAQDASRNPRVKPLSPKEIEEFSIFLEKTAAIENVDKNLKVPAEEYAWENSGKFEGDIILDKDQRQKIAAIVSKTGRTVATNLARLWNATEPIHYKIRKGDFDRSQVAEIQKVLNIITSNTCLVFNDASRSKATDVIVISGKYSGCFAAIGRRGGKQIVNLDNTHSVGSGCFRLGAIAHELFHALGFLHTHSRMDRDDYVKIQWENIREGKEKNFQKYVDRPTNLGGRDVLKYDYYSIMHYSKTAFSKNKEETIVPLQSSSRYIGQRINIFSWDINKLNAVYCNGTEPNPENPTKKPKNE